MYINLLQKDMNCIHWLYTRGPSPPLTPGTNYNSKDIYTECIHQLHKYTKNVYIYTGCISTHQ